MRKKIILTGGGTAGHVMPNVALLEHLKFHFDEILYIGSKDGIEKRLITERDIPYVGITTVKLRRSLSLKNLQIPFLLHKGVKEATAILEKHKPDVVFSKGGYVAVPVVYAAKKLSIPVVIHESDLSMGLANRLCRKKASATLVTFEQTLKEYPDGIFTGVPVRGEITAGSKVNARMNLQLSGAYPTILIMGGSMGSKKINQAVRASLTALTKKYNVIHICGKGNLDASISVQRYCQMEFTDNIADYFALADLVICRSGSNTINELLLIKKPMLLVPLSRRASRGDQIENAECFAEKGFARILYEQKLTPQNLLDSIDLSFNDRYLMTKAMTLAKKTDGVKNVLEQILKYADAPR